MNTKHERRALIGTAALCAYVSMAMLAAPIAQDAGYPWYLGFGWVVIFPAGYAVGWIGEKLLSVTDGRSHS